MPNQEIVPHYTVEGLPYISERVKTRVYDSFTRVIRLSGSPYKFDRELALYLDSENRSLFDINYEQVGQLERFTPKEALPLENAFAMGFFDNYERLRRQAVVEKNKQGVFTGIPRLELKTAVDFCGEMAVWNFEKRFQNEWNGMILATKVSNPLLYEYGRSCMHEYPIIASIREPSLFCLVGFISMVELLRQQEQISSMHTESQKSAS